VTQISHEVPLQLLDISRSFNDYDYCLVHLLNDYPKYSEFFKDSLKMGRRVILDNSVFELGEAFNSDLFALKILELKPTEYIVPDVFGDAEKTIENYKKWNENYGNLPGKKIGVVQGKNFEDLTVCYNFMHSKADKIAINFIQDYYLVHGTGDNIWQKYASGRHYFLTEMEKLGILRFTKPHHALGTALPNEFMTSDIYRKFDTIDTSNPIVQGLLGIKYSWPTLTIDKDPTKMVELFEHQFSLEQIETAVHNVRLFRKMFNNKENI